jgi:NAD(P)-dependent dehydrogenase (short-subunit alcohol dehydrogenase family)
MQPEGKSALVTGADSGIGRAIAASKTIPLARVGTAEEMAEVGLFLASDAARYVTGASYIGEAASCWSVASEPCGRR